MSQRISPNYLQKNFLCTYNLVLMKKNLCSTQQIFCSSCQRVYNNYAITRALQGFSTPRLRNSDQASLAAKAPALQGRGMGRVPPRPGQAVHPVRRSPERDRRRDRPRNGQKQGHLKQTDQPDGLLSQCHGLDTGGLAWTDQESGWRPATGYRETGRHLVDKKSFNGKHAECSLW